MIYAGGNLILTGSFFNFVDGRCIYYLYHLFKILFSVLICLFSLHFLKKQVYCVQTAITWSGNTQGLANTCV